MPRQPFHVWYDATFNKELEATTHPFPFQDELLLVRNRTILVEPQTVRGLLGNLKMQLDALLRGQFFGPLQYVVGRLGRCVLADAYNLVMVDTSGKYMRSV